jgi:hypothetical protein
MPTTIDRENASAPTADDAIEHAVSVPLELAGGVDVVRLHHEAAA